MEEESSSPECAICLQPLLYPVKLPCSHEFCYLCVKGIRDNVTKRCAMCRTNFSLQDIEKSLELPSSVSLSKFKWFYEGRSGGWWAFDEKNSGEIEKAFNISKDKTLAINIAGYTYIIDFIKMQQFRQDTPTRIRKIKRQEDDSKEDFKIKGIAGLRVAHASTSTESQIDLTKDDEQLSKSLSNIVVIDDESS